MIYNSLRSGLIQANSNLLKRCTLITVDLILNSSYTSVTFLRLLQIKYTLIHTTGAMSQRKWFYDEKWSRLDDEPQQVKLYVSVYFGLEVVLKRNKYWTFCYIMFHIVVLSIQSTFLFEKTSLSHVKHQFITNQL